MQMNNGGDLDHNGCSRGSVKWLDSGNISNKCQEYLLMD